MRLTRQAKIVLDVFRERHVQAGGSMRFDLIYLHVRDADIARKGVAALESNGLIEGNGEDAVLTPTGYSEMWSVR